MKKRLLAIALIAILAVTCLLTGCSSKKSAYEDYAAAYNKVTANGGLDAVIKADMTMDDSNVSAVGNFKLDTVSSTLFFEVDVDGHHVEQFSDGAYLYSDTENGKAKYSISESSSSDSPIQGDDRQKPDGADSAPEFNTDSFLGEFAQFLEVGKIEELGLLAAIPEAGVSSISESSGVYTITAANSVLKKYLNTMIETHSEGPGDKLKVDDISNFSYKATAKNDIVTDVEYKGTIAVTVPASLMSTGEQAKYDLTFTISISFNNPGEAVTVELPSTEGY